ncbi:MAG: class I SAM-dependent methyltransferase [Candidatus Odyssella sp.]|nr:class I SAM-dependent methyltransferase [Candidatus Odyssella sp.]
MTVDFGRTADDYARHRAGFPPEFFARLERLGLLRAGMTALDLGAGTGTIALGLAARGAAVTALDPAAAMLAQAAARAKEAGLALRTIEAKAESTGLPDAAFDLAVAGQCWHWFDRPRAAAEVLRVLKPGGTLMIAHFDWLRLAGGVVAATEDLILAHNPAWAGAGKSAPYPAWYLDLRAGGFHAIESFGFEVDVPYTHEAWRGRIRASAGIAASLPREKVAAFDAAHAALLARAFPADPLAVPHRCWAVWGTKA